jgi:hypothetical protein
MADGTSHEIALAGQYTGLRALVDGTVIPLERRLRPWEVFLVILPLALVTLGGLIGGLIGGVGTVVNSRLAQTSARTAIRALGMLGVTVLAAVIWFGLAFAIAPTLVLTTGTCLNGIREGATVTASTVSPVACTSAHDKEVIGTFDYTPNGQYPGDAALQTYAEAVCLPAFKSYVGIDLTASQLNMLPVIPTAESWAKSRQVACVVLSGDGTKLTKSVKVAAI